MSRRWTLALTLLLVNSAYLAALPSATIFYMANAVLHLCLGLVLALMAVRKLPHWPVLTGAALLGLFLAVAGNTTPHRWALMAHVAVALLAVAMVLQRRPAALAALAIAVVAVMF